MRQLSFKRYRFPPDIIRNAIWGIVRLTGRELADRRRSRLSRGELTPFSECGSAVQPEDVAAVEDDCFWLGSDLTATPDLRPQLRT